MKIKKFNTIDSILQLTKDLVKKNDRYYNYILKENNSLYSRQLPLLMKNSRINSLVLMKPKTKEREFAYQSTKNTSQKDDKKSEIDFESEQNNYYINKIRAIKFRSAKLPPLCPMFDNRGTLLRSLVTPRKDITDKIINIFDNMYNLPNSVNIKRNSAKILNDKKMKIKKILYNKSFNINLDLNYKQFKIKNLNEPLYNNLVYDESLIFGHKKIYQDIIRNKLIELQTIYNQNFTTKKEKVYKYGLHKKKIHLTLDSLKIRLNEVKDEQSFNIEVHEKPIFEYTFPFALLPLFYYKNVESFLIILTKLLIWDEENQSFSFAQNDDEIISNILKNCDDFYLIDSDNKSTIEEKDNYESDINIIDLISDNKSSTRNKSNKNLNIYDSTNNSSPLTSSVKENSNLNYLDYKNINLRSFDIYPKLMQIEHVNISTFEFFWLTPKKSFILTIETPLITVNIPSNKIMAKKYIDYDLLFFLYSKKFIQWDFYIINNLLTYKNFRTILDNLYAIPEKSDVFFYITQPKHRKNIFTSYELTSLITRERKKSPSQRKIAPENISNNSKDNIKEKQKAKSKKELFNSLEDNNKKYEENKTEKLVKINQINKEKNNSISYFNSNFIQKGLLAEVCFIDIENKIYNEYTIHFNLDQLRKFQIMEFFVDKVSFFIKFLKIDYEQKNVSFDFDSFDEFNELNWIKDFTKYNINYMNFLVKKSQKQHLFSPKMINEFTGLKNGTKIKVEIKCPLILMKVLDNNGFLTTESVNVDYRVERILKNIIIHNSIDLTRQLVNILRDNNFCRKIYVSKRATKKMGTKKRKMLNQIISNTPKITGRSLDIVPDVKED